ncbi:cytochrome P450 [Winogradskya consettensis]|uniref:Cytochrome P450 n=1 Tax=Winogradskya consettensis TaxID=113560 RepID=A0A919SB50_9ACTN|nr:cytochrome P450 [Actinoplanes consettensis]GIM68458.1 cytochrome P450 [Actinoplanes consettensis]
MTIEATAPPVPDFPMRRGCPFDPPPQYGPMREDGPAFRVRLPDTTIAWVVPRYDDVRRLLVDPRISSDRTRPGYPFLTEDSRYLSKVRVFVGMDPPEHGPHRRMFIPGFTARRIKALRPAIEENVTQRLAELAAGPRPADLVTALALPVPTLAIAQLLGVPDEDYTRFAALTGGLMTENPPRELFDELLAFVRALVSAKCAEPGDDMLGRIAAEQVATGAMSVHELVVMALLLLFAGYETTANMIALGTLTLLQHPEQLAELRADPSLMPAAVDEMLRYLSIAELATCRTAVADIDLGEGVVIRAGEGVIPLGASANRDPAAFERPDEFDIHRTERHHLAFGYGPHQCIGANLARLELEIVFTSLIRDFPGLRLAVPFGELRFKRDANLFGVHELPVTW